jgi:hypothetical protein
LLGGGGVAVLVEGGVAEADGGTGEPAEVGEQAAEAVQLVAVGGVVGGSFGGSACRSAGRGYGALAAGGLVVGVGRDTPDRSDRCGRTKGP